MDVEVDLEAAGRHALLFDDDANAAFVNSKEALVEWNSLFIDRYDVRHLLSSPPRRVRQGSIESLPSDSDLELQLDMERYADLPPPSDLPELENEEEPKDASGFHAVSFSYGYSVDSTDQKNANVDTESSVFRPPFPVPESLFQNLPPTEKVHQIIARTAMFVSEHGGQSEIILRVKQGDNPMFGFLMPYHHLHPYFRYLVDHRELLKADTNGKSQKENGEQMGGIGTGEALSMLGAVYGTGEDEDGVAAGGSEHRQMGSSENTAADNLSKSDQVDQISGSERVAQKDATISKLPRPSKEKPLGLSKHRISNAIKAGSPSSVKKGEASSSLGATADNSKPSAPRVESLVAEPPSDMKRLIDRIVEIVLKNGKEFEAVLTEQDKKNGRFPFLSPSDPYHPFYQKLLKKSQESRLSSKSLSSEKEGSLWQGTEKKPSSSMGSDTFSSRSAGLDLPLDYDRKEKFKMVIGKSKKDSLDQQSKPSESQSGISVDAAAAAAILQAATRGIKKPNLDIFSQLSMKGASSHGLSSDGQKGSSLGSHLSQPGSSKQNGGGKPSVMVPAAKEIAKTAAIAAAGEADSSEAGLTKEQKLKAERLKRAKMFTAMIKSGAAPFGKDPVHALSAEPPGPVVSGSGIEVMNQEGREREGSTALADVGTSDKAEKSEKRSSDNENEEHVSRKKRHYRSRRNDEEEEDKEGGLEKEENDDGHADDDHRRSRKKHRSHRSSKHHKDRHKHRKRRSSTKSKESRHRHRRESSSSEDENGTHHRKRHDNSDEEHKHHRHGHKKLEDSSSEDDNERHHRKKHDNSDDEHKLHRHRHKKSKYHKDEDGHEEKPRKHRKRHHTEEGELEEGEIRAKSSDGSQLSVGGGVGRELSVDVLNTNQENRNSSQPPQEATEVSDELRAKIRAMLLATM